MIKVEIAQKVLKKPGIYGIRLKNGDLIYIGMSTSSLYERICSHLVYLFQNKHYNKGLQYYFTIEELEFVSLEVCTDLEVLRKRERSWIEAFKDEKHPLVNIQHGYTNQRIHNMALMYKLRKRS